MKKILDDSGLFQTTIVTVPRAEIGNFKPDWTQYQVMVMNYNTGINGVLPEWPAETKTTFVRWMAGGGGLVSVEGHDVTGMSSVDFVTTLLRGTEWAATGKVTQKVPSDFPTNPEVLSYRLDLAKMDTSAAQPAAAPGGAPGTGRGPAAARGPAASTVGCVAK